MKTVLILIAIAAYSSSLQYTPVDVKEAFLDSKIVPDVLENAPKKIINVSYPNGVIVKLGEELTPTQVKKAPWVTWEAEEDAFYTLMMVDPDAPSRDDHSLREVRHWLVMNIPESFVESGDEVIEYLGSGAKSGTGLHRYVFLVYKQRDGIIEHNEARSTNRMRANRLVTSASEFAERYNLGEAEFGNFFQAQYDESVDRFHERFID